MVIGHSDFEIGDTIVCIQGGGNNTSMGQYTVAADKNDGKEYVVKNILSELSKHRARSIIGLEHQIIATIETECGLYLWASTKFYKKVGSAVKGPVSNYQIF